MGLVPSGRKLSGVIRCNDIGEGLAFVVIKAKKRSSWKYGLDE